MAQPSLTHYAWLSIGAAVMTMGLKFSAYLITGSVGLLSDALESGVNLVAAIVVLIALIIVARPPDTEHEFGHDKVEYFSSGFEGGLIFIAAITIAITAINRLLNPQPVESLGIGLCIALVASAINFVVARLLLGAARRHSSITLEADSKHLMTDVWTSAGVLVGIALVGITGWSWLDPIIALLVAANILYAGGHLIYRSAMGLMDTALPTEERATIQSIVDIYQTEGIQIHALRTRQSGARRFMSMHVLVPGDWSVQRAHALAERLEGQIRQALPRSFVVTHLEPLEDPSAWQDQALDYNEQAGPLKTQR